MTLRQYFSAPKSVMILALPTIMFAVTGCQPGLIHKKSSIPASSGSFNYLSVDARQRLSIAKTIRLENGEHRDIYCAEPSPNALVAVAASAAASGSGTAGTGGNQAAASLAAGATEAVTATGVRTQTIELLRDAYYRACEGLINGVVDEHDYKSIIANVDTSMVALAAIDALGGASIGANNSIGGGSIGATINGGDANVKDVKLTVQQADDGSGKIAKSKEMLVKEQAQALRDIALFALANGKARSDRISAVALADSIAKNHADMGNGRIDPVLFQRKFIEVYEAFISMGPQVSGNSATVHTHTGYSRHGGHRH